MESYKTKWIDDTYRRIIGGPFTQFDVANLLGIDNTYLNAILRRRRNGPEGLRDRIVEVVDALEEAYSAAEKAKQEVLIRRGFSVDEE